MHDEFDPNAPANAKAGIFGLPFSRAESKLVYLPVPWEVTTSYAGGTSQGPAAIFTASRQLDLWDQDLGPIYKEGLFWESEPPEIQKWNAEGKRLAQQVISRLEAGTGGDVTLLCQRVNELGEKLNQRVYAMASQVFGEAKIPAIVGGDHSVPFGAIRAAAEAVKGKLSILHFDAHMDLRDAYEGFKWSHASIFRNVMAEIPGVERLVSVGIRDFCQQEREFVQENSDRIQIFYDRDCQRRRFEDESWGQLADKMVSGLGDQVWISFDIDGLDPRFCPHTGTPVPGGLTLDEAVYLIRKVVESDRRIVGFDLNEVAPGQSPRQSDEWDANVAMRLLYQMTGWALRSAAGKPAIQI